MKGFLQFLLLCLTLQGVAHGAIDTYEFASEAERARYRQLTEELRCPKCQNQNIADSNAPIAMDLRAEIYRLLEAGDSDAQIIDFLVARYGDFVLYKPQLTSRTLLLWYGPAGLLLLGLAILAVIVLRRRRGAVGETVALSTDEKQRLAQLLEQASPEKHDP